MTTDIDHLADQPRPTMSWFIVALGIITALGPLSIDMYLPAFGDISQSLATDISHVQRSLTAYFIGLACGQMCYGPISDRFGRKRPLQIGLSLYLLASIGCALAVNIEMLTVMRCLQAFGGSAGAVIWRAMVRDRYHHNHSARVFSLLMLVMGVAPILAPIIGGAITVHLGWRAVFWTLTAASAGCILMMVRMPETRPKEKRTTELNIPSIVKVYLGIFKDRNFVVYASMGGFVMAGMFGYIAGASFTIITLYGVAKQHFGWFFGVNAFGLILATQVNSRLLARYTFQQILFASSSVMMAAGVYLILASGLHASLWLFAPGLFVYISMLGFILPNTTAGAMENQAKHAGAASALQGTLQFVVASFSTYGVSLLHDGTSMPMVVIMTFASSVAWTTYFFSTARKMGRV